MKVARHGCEQDAPRPARVEEKCKLDPSLGVAHGCFWKYHPAKAYAWELRLQHEIKPDFTIDEPDSDACRARFLEEHPDEAAAIREKEQLRRERAERKKTQAAEGPDSDAVEEGEVNTGGGGGEDEGALGSRRSARGVRCGGALALVAESAPKMRQGGKFRASVASCTPDAADDGPDRGTQVGAQTAADAGTQAGCGHAL